MDTSANAGVLPEVNIDQRLLEAIVSRRFPQNPLLNPRHFVDYLKERSTSHPSETELEALDRTGLFCPLLRVVHASSYHRIISRTIDGQVSEWEDTPLLNESWADDDVVQVIQNEPHALSEWKQANEQGRILIRSLTNFEPWETLKAEGTVVASHFYHPLQALEYFKAESLSRNELPPSFRPLSSLAFLAN